MFETWTTGYVKDESNLLLTFLTYWLSSSICISVACWYYAKMTQPVIRQLCQGLRFSQAKDLREIPGTSSPVAVPNRGGLGNAGKFWPSSHCISEVIWT